LKESAVETYPVDVDVEQVVHWLLDEQRLHAFGLLVRTTRSYQRIALGAGEDGRLGDTEREDLGECLEVGLVEVTPRHRPSLWTLRIRAADDIGPGLPDDEPVPAGEEEIDLPTFYEEFIKTDRGLAEVSAEVESPAAKGSLTRVLDAMRQDRHKPSRP
jgi:hypothetical protein